MTDRVPLIVDSQNQNVKELPIGDNLDLTGSNIVGVVDITASGVVTGTLSGNASTATALQTARTLTIGSTGKTFNGTANVAWSLSEIGVGTLGQQDSNSVTITGGTINGTVIGGSTPAAISGTTGVFGVTSLSGSNTYGTPVLGTGSASSFSAFQVESHSNVVGNGPFIGLLRSRGTQASPTNLSSGDLIGAVTAEAFRGEGTFPYRTSAAMNFVADGAHSSTSLPGRVEFTTVAPGSISRTERMRITSTGNVGIGTSAPASLLDVTSTATSVYSATSGAQNISAINVVNGAGAGQTSALYFRASGNGGTNNARGHINLIQPALNNASDFAFQLRDISGNIGEKLRITSTGNVGIGTSSPTVRLDVSDSGAGDVKARIASTGGSVSELVFDNTGVSPSGVRLGSTGTSLVLKTNATERLRITSTGNVGIGTSSPNTTLHVNSSTYNHFIGNGALITGANFASDTSVAYGTSGTNSVFFFSNNTERMRITPTGNVGIGTSSPDAKLVVSSSSFVRFLNTTAPTLNNDTHAGEALFLRSGGSDGSGNVQAVLAFGKADTSSQRSGAAIASVQTAADADQVGLAFYTSPSTASLQTMSEAARITSSGDVGIGTSSPAARLDVNADALIHGATVGRGAGSISTNTAVGNGALSSNTTGFNNTANGLSALRDNTTGNSNTANGRSALAVNTTGSDNTANGVSALVSNTTGNSNTANGRDALRCNTTGFSNTANGLEALRLNTTGCNNTANGVQALRNNTTGSFNTANGVSALFANTTGSFNTANGRDALCSNTTGFSNTANGVSALRFNTTGICNTANGVNALFANTTGFNNTANGVNALQNNTTGSDNTANGRNALLFNTTGCNNTANGVNALRDNTTGNVNTATGLNALLSNTTGFDNTANGVNALLSNTEGCNNTANGVNALRCNTTGFCNTANGLSALCSNTTGIFNTANGVNALRFNTTGNNTPPATTTSASASTQAAPGSTPAGICNITTESNYIVMGNDDHTCALIKVAWTATSDCRDKTCFKPIAHGLDFVRALKPTEYQFKQGGRDSTETDGKRRYGFLAQDILPLEGDEPVIISADNPEKLQYTEAHLIPVLVKAVQELTAEVERLRAEVEELKNA
jgi:hypothetical protein